MAEGGGDRLEEDSLEEVVTCKICFHLMEDARILLPCTHSFCAECVMELETKQHRSQNTISCPLCEEKILECNIHINSTMAELVGIVKAKKQQNTTEDCELICAQCDSTNISLTCTQCDVNLCTECKPRHARLPECKDKILSFDEAKKLHRKSIIVYCIKHPSEAIKINCLKCNMAICNACKITSHDEHPSESLESAFEWYKNTAKKALVGMKKKTSHTKSKIAEVQLKLKQVKDNQTKVQEEIDRIYEQVSLRIDMEKIELSSDLKLQCGEQLEEFETELDFLENYLRCDLSIQMYTEAIMTNTDGEVLLTGLQSGLLEKMQEPMAQSILDSKPELYKLTPPKKEPISFIGHIMPDTTEMDKASTKGRLTSPDIFDAVLKCNRHADIDLNSLKDNQFLTMHVFHVDEFANSMCYFQHKLYVPCFAQNKIKVFPINGGAPQTKLLRDIQRPQSLYPLNLHQLVLASESGLHLLDGETLTITSKLTTGHFDDVYVDGNTITALRHDIKARFDLKRVHVWEVKQNRKLQEKHSFYVTLQLGVGTLARFGNHTYVSNCEGNTINKHNKRGKCIQRYSKGAHYSRLCLADKQGNVLIANCDNNRLQLLSASGQWSQFKADFKNPRDVVIVDSKLYVLHDSKHYNSKITVLAECKNVILF